MKQVSLIVEGNEDVRFLEDFIQYHFSWSLSKENFLVVGGKSDKLHSSRPLIQASSAAGKSNLLIFDADDSDFASTSQKIQATAQSLDLKFDSIFLFPNNQNTGNLETLLKACVPADKSQVLACIDSYGTCVNGLTDLGVKPIDEKMTFYIYQQAFGLEKGSPKGSSRTYLSNGIWNLNATAVQPLKQFLDPFFSS